MEEKGKLFYGWWIVVASFFLMFAGVGILINTYGVLFGAIISDMGFSRGGLGLYFTLMALALMVASPILGKILVKYNAQVVITVCLIVSGLGFMAFSQATQLWHFYLIAIIVGLFGAGTSTLPASMLLTNWFNEKRGLAMGIAFTGSGIGGMVCNPLAQYVINNYSWQMSYVVLGIIFLAVTLPFALFVIKLFPSLKGLAPLGSTGSEDDQAASVQGLTTKEASSNALFWLLGFAFFTVLLLQVGIQNNIPIFMQDLGHSATFAASVMAVYMGLLVIGKMFLGTFLDKFGPKVGVTFCLALMIAALFFFINGQPLIMVGLFVLAFAFGSPITTVYPSYVIGHLFGNLDYGTIYGIMNIFITLGLAFAMPITGAVYDKFGTMVPVWYGFMAVALVALGLFYFILSRQPKLEEQWHS
ncbi:Major facilitator superfamily [Syntrophomonas zehnderi OL-4]|uniref:Major facilitator superfamily n=1 Tax=Syntrophomonas zehnderi OL-4 TaxID=690567 RepID=A0A0E4GBC6_9FIRM|nr:MFS transporter [Syntrophomonas zehnderi]CFX39455.1 Major facilitator superfamily [Syntrophomonas zehnderi OL-4]